MTSFSPKQLATLRLIADTFAPGDPARGIPSASQVGGPELALEMAALNPRAADVRQLKILLDTWDTKAMGLALGGKRRRFSELSRTDREELLRSLADSKLAAKRGLFTALKGASLNTYYIKGGEPVWSMMGYAGPPGPLADPPPARLTPLRVTQDLTLDCDVVVVGSGAGGGTAAGVLAEAGLDVVVLEAGDFHDESTFDGSELTGFTKLYAPAPQTSIDGQMLLVAGKGLGGGTVVNYTTSFRTPDRVREEWAAQGARQFVDQEYTDALDAVCRRLGVNTDHDLAAPRDAALERGAKALGWSTGAMPRNVQGCDMGVECGHCGMGCRIGAKQSVTKTWLEDAAAAGARLVVGTKVTRVVVRDSQATGVEALSTGGHRVVVKARAVVVAGGAVQTPALLKRSGLKNPNIGRYLRLHPATAVWGRLDEPVVPWVGAMQSRYVDEMMDLDGKGYGVLYETAPLTPAFGSGFVNWRSGAQHLQRMSELDHMLGVAVIVRDRDPGGEVKIGRDGEPIVHYILSGRDTDHLMLGFEGAAKIAEAAGATKIYSPHTRTVSYEPGVRGDLASFMADCRKEGADPGRVTLAALHIMGSARMGGHPSTSAVSPDGETWDVRNLYVADASAFPTASGVNPMISIESIAFMTARRIAAALA